MIDLSWITGACTVIVLLSVVCGVFAWHTQTRKRGGPS